MMFISFFFYNNRAGEQEPSYGKQDAQQNRKSKN